ncbi:MAG: asparaginase [Pseudomonadota bacterium]
MSSKNIVILGTGGTIAGTASRACDNVGYTAAQLTIDALVAAIPGLVSGGGILVEQLAQLDSKDMDFDLMRRLALRAHEFLTRSDVAGVVVTHGTDTIEETAFFLQSVLGPTKPIVLTCAMRPASSLQADGPQNMLDAVTVARNDGANGVTVVCAGMVHGAVEVQKMHTYKLDAFSSGDVGPVGYVEEGRLRLIRPWTENTGPSSGILKKLMAWGGGDFWPEVEIVLSHAGAGGSTVAAIAASGVKGIVVAGTGNGTVHEKLEQALLDARTAGVRIVRSTRCANGRVMSRPGDVFEAREGLSPVKARIALMLDLLATGA